jgi:hypothetical protein
MAKTQRSAWLSTGKVKVILAGGGLGELVMGATHTDVSSSRLCSGNREQVCPSGPTPSSSKSNLGKLSGEKKTANFWM